MSQILVTGEAKIRDIQGPVVANDGVITALDGAANQYVRGDGTLANFPTSGGGGSSVSYYLNGSVNQGTFGGSTYYQMSKNAITGVGTNFSASANGLIAQFITDANDPDVVSIPSGNWNVEFFMNVSASSGALASFYVEIYKYDGSTFTLLATNVATPEQLTNTTTVDAYFTSVAMPLSSMAITDRLAIRIFVNVASKTVTLYTENNRLCQVITTFSNGLTSLNNLTDQSQYLTTGTSGTNFNIASSGDTHTFNLPIASATNTGKLSSTDWSTFNNKQPAGNYVTLDTAQTITGDKTFTGIIKNDNGILLKNSFITYSNGYTSLSADTGNLVISSLIGGTPYDNEFIFTPSTSNTYTFPNATGTLALTSNLSSYVPYTGATTGLNMGNNPITTNNFFFGKAIELDAGIEEVGGSVIFRQRAGASGGGANYTTFSAIGNNILSYGFWQDAPSGTNRYKFFSFRVDNITIGTNRTYQMPDLSGTLALLEGAQTFSGSKTFSALSNFDNVIRLKQNLPSYSTSSGYTTLFSTEGGGQYGFGFYNGGGALNSLNFPTASSNAYTFPAITGTLALLEGSQTFSGTKFFSTALYAERGIVLTAGVTTFLAGSTSLNGNANGLTIGLGVTVGGTTTTYAHQLLFPQITPRTYTYPAASGTIALTSNLSAYLPLTGGTLTGALSGTSATFSSSVTAGTGSKISGTIATGAGLFQLQDSGRTAFTAQNYITFADSASTRMAFFGFTGDNNLTIGTDGSRNILLSGGNVGIGTSTIGSDFRLAVYGSNSLMAFQNANTGQGNGDGFIVGSFGNVDAYLYNYENANIIMGTNATERMRITSGGQVLIGTTNGFNGQNLIVYRSDLAAGFYTDAGTGKEAVRFWNGTTPVGTITTTGSTTSYNTSSDYRLKQDLKDFDGLSLVSAIKTYDYEWKSDNSRSYGVMAHELQKVLPYAVHGEKDGEQMQGVDYSKLVPIMVKAIQEQTQIIKDLEARIVSLESK